MQLIDLYKNTWSKKISFSDRFLFSSVLLVFSVLYVYSRYYKHHVPFADYQTDLYVMLGYLLSFVVLPFWGNFILKLWLTISGTIGQIIFFILLLVVYYVILSPVFLLVNLFKKKKQSLNSNWIENIYTNKDYQSMG